ncbi:MAG: hypothetical protein P8Q54_15145 [Akkermansiaceae bacterium]|nr:hypothetical protein [Akkermansiaceae bacterium]
MKDALDRWRHYGKRGDAEMPEILPQRQWNAVESPVDSGGGLGRKDRGALSPASHAWRIRVPRSATESFDSMRIP